MPLTFGAGVDRNTGRSVAAPSSFLDLRNVYLENARVRLRRGFGPTGFPVLPVGTDVCAIAMLEATLDILFVLYERSTRALTVYRLNPLTTPTMQSVGTWGTVDAAATLPPVISVAESYGKVFLAHAEAVFSRRLPTKVYTPNATDATVGSMATLTADLNGDTTAADVSFRGVYAYNDSLWGYGYGEETSATSKNRPDIVRVSKPADPTAFVPERYFIAGKPSTPVTGLAALPLGGLVVGKTTSAYLISGTDAETYGITLIDSNFGNLSDRGMVTERDAVWMWGMQGPRATMGGATVDMSQTLALDDPQPTGLTARGAVEHSYAFYDRVADTVEFVWPQWTTGDGPTLSYVASVRDPNNIRWSYAERAGCIPCAAWVLLGKESPPALTAYADFTAQSDGGIDATNLSVRKVSLTWDNLGSYLGTESYEVYARPAGGSWSLKTTVAHNGASTQTAVVTGFDPLQDYDVAVRATRDGGYTTGYTDADPDNWTAGTAALSKAAVQTTCGTPVMGVGTWSRISPTQVQVAISFTLQDTLAPFLLEKSTDNATWSTVTTVTGPSFPRTVSYAVVSGEENTSLYFRVTPKRGSIAGTSATGVLYYMGPANSTHGFSLLLKGFERINSVADLVFQYNRAFSALPNTASITDIQVQFCTDGVSYADLTKPWSFQNVRAPYWRFAAGLINPGTNYFRWRSVVVSYGITDYSPWQTYNWHGVDASVTPSVTWEALGVYGQWYYRRPFRPFTDLPAGHVQAVMARLASGAWVFLTYDTTGAGLGSQTFIISPYQTIGVGEPVPYPYSYGVATGSSPSWEMPSLAMRYVVIQSDFGSASELKTHPITSDPLSDY